MKIPSFFLASRMNPEADDKIAGIVRTKARAKERGGFNCCYSCRQEMIRGAVLQQEQEGRINRRPRV